ncbi:MAG: hypothetical protein DI603_18755 [Roseateles depolymerans]|uniref:Tll0287-like domain-containing protein n=1 Tax=Roseateles depolymerans TaxID=76731 RepID=A0A2W5DJW4_9BURK|nr:MAG: hypothetical protein DI603_18755 [Roseateles depolymerans]
MRIETRFAWIIAFCFCFGVTVAGTISYRLEVRQAHEEIKQKADLLLETAMSLRTFTAEELTPVLNRLNPSDFHAAQVPSFVAQTTLKRLRTKFPDYRYRESALDPTNLDDRASDWEVGLLRSFRADPERKELSGETGEGQARHFYVARPIRMQSPACLQCHSTPAAAPAAMLAKYGSGHGFGWQLGDVVAMQLVEVPTAPARARAWNSVLVTVGSLSCVFVLSAAVFLLLLRRHVTHPLEALTRSAHLESLHSEPQGGDVANVGGQFGELQAAILRLKFSLDRALRLFEGKPRDADRSEGRDDGRGDGH